MNYILEENPLSGEVRLILLANRDSSDDAEVARFNQLLANTQLNFPFVLPKNDDGSSPEPFSFIARNGCMVIRFNDCLDDDFDAVATLNERIKVLTGLPPALPFFPRVLFDPNHGALVSGEFGIVSDPAFKGKFEKHPLAEPVYGINGNFIEYLQGMAQPFDRLCRVRTAAQDFLKFGIIRIRLLPAGQPLPGSD